MFFPAIFLLPAANGSGIAAAAGVTKFTNDIFYCKQVASGTTGAYSDVYCQSMLIICKNQALFM